MLRINKFVLVCLSGMLFLTACGSTDETVLYQVSENQSAEPAFVSENEAPEQEKQSVFVYVCGQVMTPGVYEVEKGSRIYEVLNLAGGLTAQADADYLNQAEPVEDGQKLYVPAMGEMPETVPEQNTDSTAAGGLVNINTADETLLTTLNGVGASRAQSIIAYRTEHGSFNSIEEIMKVTGIKEGLFNKIKSQITVGVR